MDLSAKTRADWLWDVVRAALRELRGDETVALLLGLIGQKPRKRKRRKRCPLSELFWHSAAVQAKFWLCVDDNEARWLVLGLFAHALEGLDFSGEGRTLWLRIEGREYCLGPVDRSGSSDEVGRRVMGKLRSFLRTCSGFKGELHLRAFW
jgi:hypothetical protein